MKLSPKSLMFVMLVGFAIGGAFIFQNCARMQFNSLKSAPALFATGLCQNCTDEKGSGVQCVEKQEDPLPACSYESCNPGYQLTSGNQCIPVTCESDTVASCAVEHGEGRMTCNDNGQGYGDCLAISCDPGFTLKDDACVKNDEGGGPDPICVAGSHRDCSSEVQYGVETCNAQGTGYDSCVFGDCRPGYHLDNNQCVAHVCDPGATTPCTVSDAVGLRTCSSIGSGWGVCEITGCHSGFILKDGVCIVQVCTPGEELDCEINHGTGVKICIADGTDYGACTPTKCNDGLPPNKNQCHEHKCTPHEAATCIGEGGTGVKYCYENGLGYGECVLSHCDQGFVFKGGLCVDPDGCKEGEITACTEANGSGQRACNVSSHKLGPCILNQCNEGFVLSTQGASQACKRIK